MASLFGFTVNPTIIINFDNQSSRAVKKMRIPGQQPEDIIVYSGNENISGTVEVSIPLGKKVEHFGIKIEMIGQIG